jgi:hypothetical protein
VSWFAGGGRGAGWYHRRVATVSFGEFLVTRGLLDRFQLLRVLQLQAQHPAARIGECVVACGFLGVCEVEEALLAHDGERARATRRLAVGTESMPAVDDDEP